MRIFFELRHHTLRGHSSALHEQLPVPLFKNGLHQFRDRAHRLVAGEEHERAGFAFLGEVGDPLGQRSLVIRRLWFGHLLHEMKAHLFFVVERTPDLQRWDLLGTHAVSKIR